MYFSQEDGLNMIKTSVLLNKTKLLRFYNYIFTIHIIYNFYNNNNEVQKTGT